MAFLGFFNHHSDWSGGVEITALTAARDVNYSPSTTMFGNNTVGAIGSWSPQTDFWIHFRFYAEHASWNGSSTDGEWFSLRDTEGRIIFSTNLVSGTIVYGAGDNGIVNWATFVPVPGLLVQTDIDVHVQVNSGGNNIITVYHDNVQVATASRPWSVATGIINAIFNHADTNSNLHYSEVMVADEDTRTLRCARLDPDAVGDETDWTGTYEDILDRSDPSAIAGISNGDRESWNLSAYSGDVSPTAIRGVFVQTWGTVGATGPAQLDHFLRISSTNYDFATLFSPDAGFPNVAEWANDPATTSPWLTTAFAALQAGVEAVT